MPRRPLHSVHSQWLVQPPPYSRRKWINAAIAVFLTSQIVTPLTYYLYKEPTNERFAWRMFSSVHMSQWNQLTIVESARRGSRPDQRLVPVKDLLVESSWKGLYTSQPDIRDKFLKSYLQESRADELFYEARGVWPSGKPMAPIRLAISRGDPTVRRLDE
jgi:hypothetical protein